MLVLLYLTQSVIASCKSPITYPALGKQRTRWLILGITYPDEDIPSSNVVSSFSHLLHLQQLGAAPLGAVAIPLHQSRHDMDLEARDMNIMLAML